MIGPRPASDGFQNLDTWQGDQQMEGLTSKTPLTCIMIAGQSGEPSADCCSCANQSKWGEKHVKQS